jgi:hypothetical protein
VKLYNCSVNLGGPILHLVPKSQITAAEMLILIHLHGDDCLRMVEELGSVKTPHLKIYDELMEKYHPDVVKAVLGARVRGMKLQNEIDMVALLGGEPGDDYELEAEDDEDDGPTAASLEVANLQRANAERPKRATLALKPAAAE